MKGFFGVPLVVAFVVAGFACAANAADVAKGRAKAVQCQACHGMDGVAKIPEAPNLAGQNEDYLIKALKDFKSGARQNDMMSLVAKPLSDDDIANLAAFYHGLGR
ncbi:c-type cytochrome [Paraburkholderia terrae]|uniref:Cytochrome c biogenesis protein CcsB n=1 Tax=Paraburkholderia terrae TaxID=311230 RepID=A0ABM7TIS9_9BURK|nr:cytochrome c [Paraburkholderia terrae]BCZ78044.1 cytochrome c biogenesis protein CcsB [Paraburkholderia terrae]BDC38535.1 cytochrome c biogenesis protein CcsB [Paraburkholderia terrae]